MLEQGIRAESLSYVHDGGVVAGPFQIGGMADLAVLSVEAFTGCEVIFFGRGLEGVFPHLQYPGHFIGVYVEQSCFGVESGAAPLGASVEAGEYQGGLESGRVEHTAPAEAGHLCPDFLLAGIRQVGVDVGRGEFLAYESRRLEGNGLGGPKLLAR